MLFILFSLGLVWASPRKAYLTKTRKQMVDCVMNALVYGEKPKGFCRKVLMLLSKNALALTAPGKAIMNFDKPAKLAALLANQRGTRIAIRKFERLYMENGKKSITNSKLRKCSNMAMKGRYAGSCKRKIMNIVNFFLTKTAPGQVYKYMEKEKMKCVNKVRQGMKPTGNCKPVIQEFIKFFIGKTSPGKVLRATTPAQIKRILAKQKATMLANGEALKGIPRKKIKFCGIMLTKGQWMDGCKSILRKTTRFFLTTAPGKVFMGHY